MAARQKKFVFVAVGYFIKWVEAEVVWGIMTNDIKSFIWKNIMIRFGVL